MDFSVDDIIDIALREDIGAGDITTDFLVDCESKGLGELRAKEPFTLAGIDVARRVFRRIDSTVAFPQCFEDGRYVAVGDVVLTVSGSLRTLLTGERTALNFLQRLSGIATLTGKYIDAVAGRDVRLVDTRKTTPGLRLLEKYAVRVGGGYNHRTGLFDGVLIKDNHIAAAGGISPAVTRIRQSVSHLVKIEVETEDLAQVQEALDAGADVIMLDNMTTKEIRKAVSLIDGRALVEISGGVTLETVSGLADTGVNIISVGALTHSAQSVDISMSIRNEDETA